MDNLDIFLAEADTVAIAGHVRPDGDCVGSCLAVYNYIRENFPEISVTVYLQEIPNIFKFLKHADQIGFEILHLDFSPIKGPEGNIEYLLHIQKNGRTKDAEEELTEMKKELIGQTVKKAHEALDV